DPWSESVSRGEYPVSLPERNGRSGQCKRRSFLTRAAGEALQPTHLRRKEIVNLSGEPLPGEVSLESSATGSPHVGTQIALLDDLGQRLGDLLRRVLLEDEGGNAVLDVLGDPCRAAHNENAGAR